MTPTLTSRRGFTLVEMLVALMVFAVVAAAGTSLLSATLTNKEALAAQSDRLSELRVARALMRDDFAQIARRPVRDEFGGPAQAVFIGGIAFGDEPLVAFVRAGWDNPGGRAARGSLQYVEYVLDGENLIRRARARVDATFDTPVDERVVLTGVTDATVRFLNRAQWVEDWRAGFTSPLPRAVSLTIDLAGIGEVEQIFLAPGNG